MLGEMNVALFLSLPPAWARGADSVGGENGANVGRGDVSAAVCDW